MSNGKAKKPVWPPPKLDTRCDDFFQTETERAYTQHLFNEWYAERIEPLGPGVAVTGDYDPAEDVCYWSNISEDCDTHRAILIGIEPIREPSAEIERLKEREAKLVASLESISRNSCCGTCQEAKLVALAALEANKAAKDEQ